MVQYPDTEPNATILSGSSQAKSYAINPPLEKPHAYILFESMAKLDDTLSINASIYPTSS